MPYLLTSEIGTQRNATRSDPCPLLGVKLTSPDMATMSPNDALNGHPTGQPQCPLPDE